MKTMIKNSLLACGAVLALGSCSDNSWNDHLDGFDPNPVYQDVQSLDYTLTDADYNRLASNRFNVAKATAAGVLNELKAVGTSHYFNSAIDPKDYIPNLLKDSLFKYYTLTEGSAINVTFNIAQSLPEQYYDLQSVSEYTVSDEDYQSVYGSDDDYAASFSPSHSASRNIPAILSANVEAEDGAYVVVNYNDSDVDPVFSAQPTPPTPEFALSSVLGTASTGDHLDVNGIVTAKCTRGYILTDATGSILVYNASFDWNSVEIGDQLVVSADISYYGNGLQIAENAASVEKKGSQAYTYPTAIELTNDYLAKAAANTVPALAVYGEMTGTVNLSGNYINIVLDTDQVRGSVYYADDALKAQLTDGSRVKLYGYFTSTSGKSTPYNCNILVTKVETATKANVKRRVATVPSTNTNAVYKYEGGKWVAASSDIVVLQPADYKAMGQSYGNLSSTAEPEVYLPTYLKTSLPYAQDGDEKYVLYKYYANSVTTYVCGLYVLTGTTWAPYSAYTTETEQYVYASNGWVMDPSITVTLPAGRNQPLSTKFFQACVDWVKDYAPDGAAYVTSYGNNEYYSGTSAYQGNVDLRPSAAKAQYPGYDSMTDAEIVALEKERFEKEVMPGALAMLYPNLDVMAGVETFFTIHFAAYDGTTKEYTIIYKVVGKAKFEFISCTWND